MSEVLQSKTLMKKEDKVSNNLECKSSIKEEKKEHDPAGNLKRISESSADSKEPSLRLSSVDQGIMLTIEIFNYYNYLRTLQQDAMKRGMLQLAKARYIMGNHRVSAAQLPGPEDICKASLKVYTNIDPSSDMYQVKIINLPGETKSADNFSLDTGMHKVSDKDEQMTKDDGEFRASNPLCWFGVLVPKELKLARSEFKETTRLLVEIANVQHFLRHSCLTFDYLRQNALQNDFKCLELDP